MGALVVLAAEAGSVVPGSELRCVALVRNTGVRRDDFHVVVQGPAAAWAHVEPTTLSLDPGEEAPAWVTFHPPRSTELTGGLVPYAVAVAPSGDPTAVAVEEGAVELLPFRELTAALEPPVSDGRRARYRVIVTNEGTQEEEITVRVADPNGSLAVTADPSVLYLGPGESAPLDVDVRRRRSLRHADQDEAGASFRIHVTAGDEDVVVLDAAITPESALRRDLRRSAFVLAAALVLLLLLVAPTLTDNGGDAGTGVGAGTTSGEQYAGGAPPAAPPTSAAERPLGGEQELPPPPTTAPPASPVPAAAPGADVGAVVFVRSGPDGKDLVVRDQSGQETRLTSPDLEERRPTLSPDGTRIAFLGTEVGQPTRVCLSERSGGSYWCVATAALDSSLGWSADGQRLYYGRGGRLWSVPAAAATEAAPVESDTGVEVPGHRFAVAPAGDRVAVVERGRLRLVDMGGGGGVDLVVAPSVDNPAFSPDGATLVVDDGNDVWITGLDGVGRRRLTTHATVDVEPVFSRDGRWVLFRSNRTGAGDLYAVGAGSVEEGGIVQLTTSPTADAAPGT